MSTKKLFTKSPTTHHVESTKKIKNFNIETEGDNDVESEPEPETKPDTETESLCYGDCQCEIEPLIKENKEKKTMTILNLSEKCLPTQEID